MSTSTDKGIQTLSFDYLEEMTSENYNNLLHNILQPGIYSGGVLTRLSDTTVQVSAPEVYILDSTVVGGNLKVGTHIWVDNPVNVTIDASIPYIVLRFEWKNVSSNYMDFIAVAYADIRTNDLVVGRAVYSGASIIDFDYTDRDSITLYPSIPGLDSSDRFKIYATEPVFSNTVELRTGGKLQIKDSSVTVADSQTSSTISSTTDGRIDLVWLDTDGTLKVTQGVDNATPSAPNYGAKYVVAEIHRGASKSTITGADIIDVRPTSNVSSKEIYDALDTHAALTGSSAHGATSAATASQIITRDASGRAKVAAPSASDDIAIKNTVDTHAALTGSSAHGATSSPTASQIITRDASGRAEIVWPSTISEISTKGYVDLNIYKKETTNGILIPLYIYPTDVLSNTTYNNLIALAKEHHNVQTYVILNPNNGPDVSVDGNYTAAINRLHGAGIKVLMYIHSSYGVVLESTLEGQIDTYLSQYPLIDGIFCDEMKYTYPPPQADIDYYVDLTVYAHKNNLLMVANPGVVVNEDYYDNLTADIIVVYENSTYPDEATLRGSDAFNGSHMDYDYRRRAGLVYNQTGIDFTNLRMMQKYLGWIYITEDNTPNPWDILSAAIENLYQYLDSSQDATSSNEAFTVILRDANGRAQVADPSAAADIATKHYVDTFADVGAHAALTGADGVHGATSANTASMIVARDSDGSFSMGTLTARGIACNDYGITINAGTGTALTIGQGGDLLITAQVSGSDTVLNNDTGTLIISTPISVSSGSGNRLILTTTGDGSYPNFPMRITGPGSESYIGSREIKSTYLTADKYVSNAIVLYDKSGDSSYPSRSVCLVSAGSQYDFWIVDSGGTWRRDY